MLNTAIDFVAPPFAGHIFPLLDLANKLRLHGFDNLRILSTPEVASAAQAYRLPFVAILPSLSHRILDIADRPYRVGANPIRLFGQLNDNLSLLKQLRAELESQWRLQRPDLVIADFTVPTAGLLAESMGIRWWTAMPSPCVFETGDGTPAYLGGLGPGVNRAQRLRDALGRSLTRGFKRTLHAIFQSHMRELGVERVYQDDGYETIYSRDTVLALGMKDFEFPRTWPNWFQFIGPFTASPPCAHTEPVFESGKRHILVSLGTHLWWAKQETSHLMKAVAQRLPNTIVHFTYGKLGAVTPCIDDNMHIYDYLPYDKYMARYDVCISHAGTGVLYSALKNGVPTLAWPQDYDQFDHAARIVHHGLGLRCRPQVEKLVEDINTLSIHAGIRGKIQHFREQLRALDPIRIIIARLGS